MGATIQSMVRAMTPRRKKIALVIAIIADATQLGFLPVFSEGVLSIPDALLDVGVAVALTITLGFTWRLVAALALELLPGVALFPSWTAFVATLPAAPRASGALPAETRPDSARRGGKDALP